MPRRIHGIFVFFQRSSLSQIRLLNSIFHTYSSASGRQAEILLSLIFCMSAVFSLVIEFDFGLKRFVQRTAFSRALAAALGELMAIMRKVNTALPAFPRISVRKPCVS